MPFSDPRSKRSDRGNAVVPSGESKMMTPFAMSIAAAAGMGGAMFWVSSGSIAMTLISGVAAGVGAYVTGRRIRR